MFFFPEDRSLSILFDVSSSRWKAESPPLIDYFEAEPMTSEPPVIDSSFSAPVEFLSSLETRFSPDARLGPLVISLLVIDASMPFELMKSVGGS